MELIRPRLTDYHGIHTSQVELDFAIPFFTEDIPLYLDPFLLWKSPSQQDQALHTTIVNSFNQINYLLKKNRKEDAIAILIEGSECSEVGLGSSKKRKGVKIGSDLANKIVNLFNDIPQYNQFGFTHFEVIQLYIEGISKDRVSDIACSFLKSFLIDYTIQNCIEQKIPLCKQNVSSLYSYKKYSFESNISVELPINPVSNEPIIFVPKRWLRYTPWINYDDYFASYCPKDDLINPEACTEKVKVLQYNRDNYGVIENYISIKDKTSANCQNDPLFSQIPVTSAKRKLQDILNLPTGKDDNSDQQYEKYCTELMSSILYPHLDFAQSQSRTESGRHIRDLIFYNNRSIDFLDEIFADYSNRQLIFELKNVKAITRDHINQLVRYLDGGFGKFGILLTRNPMPSAMFKNTIDLWSAQRKCIIEVTDEDLKLMVGVYESKQRLPIEILKKKYIEFRRKCPT